MQVQTATGTSEAAIFQKARLISHKRGDLSYWNPTGIQPIDQVTACRWAPAVGGVFMTCLLISI
eukprot:1501500-Pleurochrysis_carterae.AAC.1